MISEPEKENSVLATLSMFKTLTKDYNNYRALLLKGAAQFHATSHNQMVVVYDVMFITSEIDNMKMLS